MKLIFHHEIVSLLKLPLMKHCEICLNKTAKNLKFKISSSRCAHVNDSRKNNLEFPEWIFREFECGIEEKLSSKKSNISWITIQLSKRKKNFIKLLEFLIKNKRSSWYVSLWFKNFKLQFRRIWISMKFKIHS